MIVMNSIANYKCNVIFVIDLQYQFYGPIIIIVIIVDFRYDIYCMELIKYLNMSFDECLFSANYYIYHFILFNYKMFCDEPSLQT